MSITLSLFYYYSKKFISLSQRMRVTAATIGNRTHQNRTIARRANLQRKLSSCMIVRLQNINRRMRWNWIVVMMRQRREGVKVDRTIALTI